MLIMPRYGGIRRKRRSGIRGYRRHGYRRYGYRHKKCIASSDLDSTGLTLYKGPKSEYKARRESKYKRYARKRFTKLVRNVTSHELAMQTYVTSHTVTAVSGAGLQQYVGFSSLMSPNGTSSTDNDLQLLFGQALLNAPNPGTGFPLSQNSMKLGFISAVGDLRITASTGVVVDIFECVCRKDWSTGTVAYQSIGNAYAEGWSSATPLDVSPATGLEVGSSPFDVPIFLQNWKVIKKERFVLGNQSISYIVKRKFNGRVFTGEQVGGKACMKGQHGLLVLFSGMPSSGSGAQSVTVYCSYARTYHYTVNVNQFIAHS